MKQTFRGEAGQVALGFVSPLTLLTALPVVALNVLLLGLAAFFAGTLELPPHVTIPLLAASIGPVVGLFACAARRGKLDAGFLDSLAGDAAAFVPGFCLRYSVLAVLWGVPLALLAGEAGESLGALVGAAMMGGLGGASAGPGLVEATWLVMSVLALAALAPALSLLVATRANTVGDLVSGRLWGWLLKDRGNDLVPFFATYVGGMMLFALGLVPLAVLAVPMAFSVSEEAGQMAMALLPALPVAAAPIFLGRLAGAFVSADFAVEPEHATPPLQASPPADAQRPAQRETRVAGRTAAGLASLHVHATASRHSDISAALDGGSGGPGLPLGVALARAHQRAETDPAGALADLESLRVQHGRNPAVAAECARLLLRLGRDDEARRVAADAIRLALTGGAGPIAFDVFMAFAAHAPLLGLDAATHEQLAKVLLQRQEFDGAAWCFRAVGTLGGESSVVQKGVLAVAESALRCGQPARAADFYEGFLRSWPESPLRGFAVEGLDDARRKQLTSVR